MRAATGENWLMNTRPPGSSRLSTAPLVFAGHVLGWAAKHTACLAILDCCVEAGARLDAASQPHPQ